MTDFAAGVVHGLLVVVSPEGWRVRRKGTVLASGNETGAEGLRQAWSAVERIGR